MEKVGKSGTSRIVQGELIAEKLTYTAVPKRHMAVGLANGGIQILSTLLTSQGQAGDFTRH